MATDEDAPCPNDSNCSNCCYNKFIDECHPYIISPGDTKIYKFVSATVNNSLFWFRHICGA